MIRRLILRLTHKMWNREISRILSDACGGDDKIISHKQLYELHARFDPTQKHEVRY